MPKLPSPYTPAIESAIYKQQPTDFIVHEKLGIECSHTGEHLWLHIQKTRMNTNFVAKVLSQWAGIPLKDVGYSGLKDRHALTTQWFSLRLPKKIAPEQNFGQFVQTKLAGDETLEILAQHWHHKKLGRGTHEANQFIITLRNVVGEKAAIEQQLATIKTQGVPNYFGEQRFGQDANNIDVAIELFTHHTIRGKKIHRKFDQDKISLYLSAARSELFNAILAKRIALGIWNQPLDGDVMNLAGSNSIFVAQHIDETMLSRLQSGDIHLTAPMWGAGELKSSGKVNALELSVITDNPIYQQLSQGLIEFGLKQQRRPLRMLPSNLQWVWQDGETLVLDFELPAGSFATTMIDTLVASSVLTTEL